MTASAHTVPEDVARVLRDGAPAVFLSPHLDDAVLSCAALMRQMAVKAPVSVVTAFSEAASPPHTRAARAFLGQCGATGAASLFAERQREDVAVLDDLGIRHVHLGHPDALFRRRSDPSGLLRHVGRVLPEVDHRYPTFRFDIALGRVSRGDRQLLDEITTQVEDVSADATVFAPVGVGRHVDHLLARAVGERLGATLYADFPYTVRDPGAASAAARERRPWAWTHGLAEKPAVIAGYRTQVDALFPGGEIPLQPETYYAPAS
jgi:LmbE family N-acetylglucosaminyl deacetylase